MHRVKKKETLKKASETKREVLCCEIKRELGSLVYFGHLSWFCLMEPVQGLDHPSSETRNKHQSTSVVSVVLVLMFAFI